MFVVLDGRILLQLPIVGLRKRVRLRDPERLCVDVLSVSFCSFVKLKGCVYKESSIVVFSTYSGT